MSKSMTFFPKFYADKKDNILYIDIAGLNDTGGEKIEIINQLITKKIFNVVGRT